MHSDRFFLKMLMQVKLIMKLKDHNGRKADVNIGKEEFLPAALIKHIEYCVTM